MYRHLSFAILKCPIQISKCYLRDGRTVLSQKFSSLTDYQTDQRNVPKTKITTINKSLDAEKLYIIAQNDPDIFGNQQKPEGIPVVDTQLFDEEAGDIAEEQFLQNPPKKSQKLSTKQYADMIKDHLKNKRIKEAIDVLEVKMLKEDRVKPENYIFNLVIGACGRYGYSKKAFSLYNKMKQRQLKVTGGTYTALFNACSMAPWLNDGLNKANRLREIMLEKGYEPNATNYNAMIKAYGRCGDIKTAFLLVDEMSTKQLDVQADTFNFLLQACASDKNYGFRHALLVWHKMRRRNIRPDVYSFNAMLRCVRDCSIGDLETMHQVIQQILLESKQPNHLVADTKDGTYLLSGGQDDQTHSQITEYNSLPTKVDTSDETPNLLSASPHLGDLIEIHEIQTPSDRLLLLGGAGEFLTEMERVKAAPDIKTFTQLIDIIPSTNAAEKKLIAALRKAAIKCDIDFFNMLMKKRSMRFDYESAKEVLSMIKTAQLQPDIVTYGVLSLGCQTAEQAHELLQEMCDEGIRINIQILGAMLRSGCVHRNFDYILEIMDIVKNERIKPNEEFLKHLDNFKKNCAKLKKSTHPISQAPSFRQDYFKFKMELGKWKDFMGLNNLEIDEAVKIVRQHPWEQFQKDQPDGKEELKYPKKRHKKKLMRHIQKIKVNRLNDCPSSNDAGVKSIE